MLTLIMKQDLSEHKPMFFNKNQVAIYMPEIDQMKALFFSLRARQPHTSQSKTCAKDTAREPKIASTVQLKCGSLMPLLGKSLSSIKSREKDISRTKVSEIVPVFPCMLASDTFNNFEVVC